ncbi:MAG: DNA polymerase III subunit beta [Firmicutes bacterium]|nr:DNA polymerase III subunit beta [Bacillota bacterium]
MKVNLLKDDLAAAVQAVARAASGKNTVPILGGIYLQASGDQLIFRATDLEIAMECVISADVEAEGVTVVPGRIFNDMVRCLPAGDVTLTVEGGKMLVAYAESELSLNCLDAEEFPLLPKGEGQISGAIDARSFRRLVRQVSVAAASDESRPIFTGIFIRVENGSVTMVATDMHRLAVGKGDWQGEGSIELIIPCRTMQEIARLANDEEELIQITASQNQACFSFANITMTSRVIAGQYPDYRQVLPEPQLYVTNTLVSKAAMMAALERAVLLGRDMNRGRGNIVKLEWLAHKLVMTSSATDVGRNVEQIPASLTGEELAANYNSRYLLEALKVIDGERVSFHLTGANTPGVIVPEGEDTLIGSYIYLILPVRV